MSVEKQKNRTVVGLVAMVSVFFVVLIIFSVYTVNIFKNSDEKGIAGLRKSLSKSMVGVIEIEKTIMSSKQTLKLLHRAEADDDIKAIIMRVNSPGGAVAPTQEIYNEIRRIDGEYTKTKGKKGKPIYASFSSVAASGGYYIGAATRRICTLPGTITGSIGVIMQFMDLSKVYQLARVRPEIIKAGRYKDIGQPSRSMTEEERGLMNNMINGVHKQFITDIQKMRKDKIVGDITELAQGQIFSGEQAVKLGLADELSGLWGCARNIHKELKFTKNLNLKYIKKKKKFNFMETLQSLDSVASKFAKMFTESGSPVLMFK